MCSQDKWTDFLYCVASGTHPSTPFSAIEKFMAVHPFLSVPVQLFMVCAIPSLLTCLHVNWHKKIH